MDNDLKNLPDGLPIPVDDGACSHLESMVLPSVQLKAIDGSLVDLSKLEGKFVLYIYPMTGRPGVPLPDGWDSIPGARGCTPQSCSFRDHYQELMNFGVSVYGLSTQPSEYQKEAASRLHLPFVLLSDSDLELITALSIPTFEADGQVLAKRVTLVCANHKIEKVFYPVFPPDQNAEQVAAYLSEKTDPVAGGDAAS